MLHGSGGYVVANITDEQHKKADLGVGKLFLAPIGKLKEESIKKYFCKNCNEEFGIPPGINIEEKNQEEVADNLLLIERGQYNCNKCQTIIGEYRVFQKQNESNDVGNAKPKSQ